MASSQGTRSDSVFTPVPVHEVATEAQPNVPPQPAGTSDAETAAQAERRNLENTTFEAPLLVDDFDQINVISVYAAATAPHNHVQTGNLWTLCLACASTLDYLSPFFTIKILAEHDTKLRVPVQLPDRFIGHKAKTTVSVHHAFETWPDKRYEHVNFVVPRRFPFSKVLDYIGSCCLDQWVFDDNHRGSRYWMWALACALGKDGYLTVTQEGWDEVFNKLWTKYPLGSGGMYEDYPEREDGDPGPNWSGPTSSNDEPG